MFVRQRLNIDLITMHPVYVSDKLFENKELAIVLLNL
jgi:hypothetical protein